MKVYQATDSIPSFRRAVITIGTFDGVHVGHQQVITQLKQEARRIDGETVIITFHPHPRKVVATDKPTLHLINTIEEKIELLAKNGIDHLVIVPFTKEFSSLTPQEYIERFLIARFHPHTVIIGYDHRFGKGRLGDYTLLEQYSETGAFELKEIPAHIINENTVSSTLIREAVLKGDIHTANHLLGYDFFFEGVVVEGNKLGRTLGYPTANLQVENEEKLVPANGIYAVQATIGNRQQAIGNNSPLTTDNSLLNGMMSIGVRPTIDASSTTRVIEVNLFDFSESIYGQTLRVLVKKYLRAEEKFNGLDALVAQIGRDKEEALKVLRG